MFDFEKKWQERWAEAKVFEANPDGRPKKYITAAFPYPNSPQHIGHGRTYTIADVYARFWRMRGYNVLFPMAFHVTGTPILAMAKRLEQKDEELLSIFENIYGIPRNKALSLTDPRELVLYFSREIEQGMKEMGYSIDWRRKFYTFDPHFSAFIQWQFKVLHKKGCLKRGKQPLAWCPSCNNALSSHDTKGDVDPEIEEMVVILFKVDDFFLPTATYRPETLFGVTNVWVNPEASYVVAKSDISGKEVKLLLTKEAFEQLKHQLSLEPVAEMPGKALIGKKALAPWLNIEVPILPASFVDPAQGTGAVMSVPGHAPFDYIALRDLQREGSALEIEPKKIIALEGYDLPAKDAVERMGIGSQKDPKLEEATKEVYRKELLEGKMIVEPFAGVPVKEARDKVKEALVEKGEAFIIYVIANSPVFCRCGTRAVVKVVEDQWFINYALPWWKEKAKEALDEMRILPEKSKEVFYQVIDWLKEKPCTRNRGLGTRFPFAEDQIIEPLSDSTIYPAFYTIAHLHDVSHPLSDEELDYIFLGIGKGTDRAKRMRAEFLYWYPCDSRHSGADLIWNHLTFYIFNHVAIFDHPLWPKQIVANAFVLMEGQKMSKSLGNILPLRKAIRQYGADTIRMSLVGGAELDGDTDFSDAVAKGIRARLEFFLGLVERANKPAERPVDYWLLSVLHKRLRRLREEYENLQLRAIVKELFYDLYHEVQWYLRRTDRPCMREFFKAWIPALAPIIPHVAEEMWEKIGERPFVSLASIDVFEERFVNEELELLEGMLRSLTTDISEIIEKTGKRPSRVRIYLPADWKYSAYDLLRLQKDMRKAMECAKCKEALKPYMAKLPSFFKPYLKRIHALPAVPEKAKLKDYLMENKGFLERTFKASVEILEEDGTKPSAPDKLGVWLE